MKTEMESLNKYVEGLESNISLAERLRHIATLSELMTNGSLSNEAIVDFNELCTTTILILQKDLLESQMHLLKTQQEVIEFSAVYRQRIKTLENNNNEIASLIYQQGIFSQKEATA